MIQKVTKMKKLFFCLLVLTVSIGAKATIRVSNDTIWIEGATQSDFTNDIINNMSNMHVAYIKGTMDASLFNDKVKTKLSNVTFMDWSEMAPASFVSFTSSPYDPFKMFCENFKELKELYLPEGITTIPHQLFFQAPKLEDVHIPTSVRTIEYEAFQDAEALKHITLPEGIQYIQQKAFYQCKALESVHLPNTLKTIGDDAFRECKGMSQLVIPASVTEIGRRAFQNSGLKDIYVMSKDVTKLPKIYPDTRTDDNDGTFTATEDLGTNSESIVVEAVQWGNNNYDYPARLAHFKSAAGGNLTDSLAKEKCKVELKELILQHMTETGSILTVVLHYPNLPELKSFYDANPDGIRKSPGSVDSTDVNQPVATYLSETYNIKDEAGNLWPAKGDTGYGDLSAIAQNQHKDYDNRINAGKDPRTHGFVYPSEYGWRQLPIHHGFTNEEVIVRSVDDTWYTLCPPYDVTDEQLAIAYNEGFNLAEFDAARIMKVEGEDALVFFFTKVSKAYTRSDGCSVLARGGHPYMIHPNKGVKPGSGNRADAILAMTLYNPAPGDTYEPAGKTKIQFLKDARNATKSYRDWGGTDDTRQEVYYDGEVDLDYTFTFIGKTSEKEEAIGKGNYFLGCESDNGYGSAFYPKFYRETYDGIKGSGNNKSGLWTRYTAIIKPGEGVEDYLNSLNTGTATGGAKKVDVEFGLKDMEILTPTAIQEVLKDAQEKKQDVKYMPVVYNINGQVVRTDSINLDGLPRGMYVVNGKKYFVK